ncbi:MAG: LPS-assembly protein LptD [Betaproteobacteria bacterium]|nr:LPS-assembly protein LptD [Betaproteobacteria bacterium]
MNGRFFHSFAVLFLVAGAWIVEDVRAAEPAVSEAPEPSRLVPAMPTLALDYYADSQVNQPLALQQSSILEGADNKQDKEKTPVFISADSITGQSEEFTRAEGRVELRSAEGLAFADKVTYYPLEDEVEAVGNVRLIQDGVEVDGIYMRLKMTDRIGHFDEVRYQISKDTPSKARGMADDMPALPLRVSTSFGQASRVHFEGENQYRLENATYSTCRPEEQDWFVKSGEIKLDFDRNEGKARQATLHFKDTPILYTPYLSFPLNNQRESGLLVPTYASTTRTGLDLSLPYYWNIAPNYDATITPRLMSKRGMQLGTELRYLDHYANTSLQLEYLNRDREYQDKRYSYSWKYAQNLGGGFSTRIDWNRASDHEYFTDLSSRVVQTAQRQLPRDFNLSYYGSGLSVNLRTLRYQTLNPSDVDNLDKPYSMMPQIAANFRRTLPMGLDADAIGQYTYFDHPTLEKGGRALLYPQLSLPFIRPGYYITPKVGLFMSRYQLSRRDSQALPKNPSLTLPILSLDTGMMFERDMSLLGTDWTQTLEPRLYYVRIPYKDQDDFPIFDTSIADFNFGQIFSENRFAGFDRMNNANQLTAALTTRLIDPKTGAEHARLMVGQRTYFSDLRVGMPDEKSLYRNKTSNLLAAFSGKVWARTYADMALEHDVKSGITQRATFAVRYQHAYGQNISASYRYNRGVHASVGATEPLKQIDIAGQWRLANRWYAVGRYNYSFDTSRLIEGIAGVEYHAGCWAARFVVQRLETTAGSPNTSIFFQLELNDFAQIGSNPIQLLRRSVPGYTKVNELPELSSGMLFPNE